jgi:hypothetical protein
MSDTIEVNEVVVGDEQNAQTIEPAVVLPKSEEKPIVRGLYGFLNAPPLTNLPVRTPKDKLGFIPKGICNQTRKQWNEAYPGKWLTVGPDLELGRKSMTLVRDKTKGVPNTNDPDPEKKGEMLSNVIVHDFTMSRRMRRASR